MVNKALVGTVLASVTALILMIAAFSVPQWQNKKVSEDTNGNTGAVTTVSYQVGMTTWTFNSETDDSNGNLQTKSTLQGQLASDGSFVITTTTPTLTTTSTMNPPQSTTFYQNAGVVSLINDSITARNGALGTGIPAFLLGLVFLIMLGVSQQGRGKTWFRPIAVLLCVLTAVMTFIGVFLYSKVLDIGFSFILWAGFAIFCLLGGIFTIIGDTGKKGRFLPLTCMILAIILGVVSLSTKNWYSEVNDSRPSGQQVVTANAGVKAYTVLTQNYDTTGVTLQSSQQIWSSFDSDTFQQETDVVSPPSSQTLTITKCPTTPTGGPCYQATAQENSRFKDFIPGGQQALGCGIPALILALIATLMMVMLLRASAHAYTKPAALGCAFVGSALGFLGLFLYAAVSSVGASFIIYSAAGFMWVLASCMAFGLLGGAAAFKPNGSDQTPKSNNNSNAKSPAAAKTNTNDTPAAP